MDFIQHGIQSLSATLSTLNLNIGSHGAEVDVSVALGMVDCLIMFLKGSRSSFAVTETESTDLSRHIEPVPVEAGFSVFPNPLGLLKRLHSMIPEALSVVNSSEADLLATSCFAALFKASLCSHIFWEHFKNADVCSALLRRLLLDEPKWQIRVRVAEYVKSICRPLPA